MLNLVYRKKSVRDMNENVENGVGICGFPIKQKINSQNRKIMEKIKTKIADCTYYEVEKMPKPLVLSCDLLTTLDKTANVLIKLDEKSRSYEECVEKRFSQKLTRRKDAQGENLDMSETVGATGVFCCEDRLRGVTIRGSLLCFGPDNRWSILRRVVHR